MYQQKRKERLQSETDSASSKIKGGLLTYKFSDTFYKPVCLSMAHSFPSRQQLRTGMHVGEMCEVWTRKSMGSHFAQARRAIGDILQQKVGCSYREPSQTDLALSVCSRMVRPMEELNLTLTLKTLPCLSGISTTLHNKFGESPITINVGLLFLPTDADFALTFLLVR